MLQMLALKDFQGARVEVGLPADAEIVDARWSGFVELAVSSSEWGEVPEGEAIPEFALSYRGDE